MGEIIYWLIGASVALMAFALIFKLLAFMCNTSWRGITFVIDLFNSIKETISEVTGNVSNNKKKFTKKKAPSINNGKRKDNVSEMKPNLNDDDELAMDIEESEINEKEYKINSKTIDFNDYKYRKEK